MKKIIDKSFFVFLLVGVGNTLLSAVLMFLLEDLGYWLSTAIAYIAGAALSFFLNKYITFKSDASLVKTAAKFVLNVALCYIIAYSLAKPLAGWILGFTAIAPVWQDRITKLFGMGIYTLINYFGQLFFTFSKKF